MSLPDENLPLASFVQEEMIDRASQSLAQCLAQLPPIVRLRLLAFMHLVEFPDTMKAALEITPSGSMRLILDTEVAPDNAALPLRPHEKGSAPIGSAEPLRADRYQAAFVFTRASASLVRSRSVFFSS